MTFFDTVAGHRFTESTLPALINELEKINSKEQYTVTYSSHSLEAGINNELRSGSKVVSMLKIRDDDIIVIYEK